MTRHDRIAADETRSQNKGQDGDQDEQTATAPWSLAKQATNIVSSLMFGCVFAVFAYKIVMRYVAGDAVAWADEVSVILFIWILFWGNAFVVEDHQQIKF